MKNLLKSLARPIRRFLGVEAILQNQRQIINALSIEARSQEYFAALDVLHLLEPMDLTGCSYVRLGRDHDGGYVFVSEMLEAAKIAYSFGIADDTSWEEDIAERDLDVFLFDHTIEPPEIRNRRLHFAPNGITGFKPIERCKPLDHLLALNGHENETNMVLKLDVEGCEWDVFEQCTSETLAQFSQIAVELHGLTPWMPEKHLEALRKLNITHQCVHVHGARSSHPGTTPFVTGNLILPKQIEVTYVRRKDVQGQLTVNERLFPTALDMCSFPDIADVPLGTFSPCPPSNS